MTDIDVGKKVEELEKLTEKHRWISVEEKFPETGLPVLVDVCAGQMMIACFALPDGERRWWDGQRAHFISKGTRWRNLPEPDDNDFSVLCAELKKAREERDRWKSAYQDLREDSKGYEVERSRNADRFAREGY